MAKRTLDRISIGPLENKENLENKGKVSFKLHVHRNESLGNQYVDHYFIIGKLSNGEVVFDQSIPQQKLIDRQKFLQEVNDDLTQIKGYLTEADYSKRFPAFWMHKVEGILYKEKVKTRKSKK